MVKDLNYYLNLPYTLELIPDSRSWFIKIKELPGCMSQGDSPNHAVRMIRDAMKGYIEICLEDNLVIPEPLENMI